MDETVQRLRRHPGRLSEANDDRQGLAPEIVLVGHTLITERPPPERTYIVRDTGLTLLLHGEIELLMDGLPIPPERPLMWLVPPGTRCQERCGSALESRWVVFRGTGLGIRTGGPVLELRSPHTITRIPRWKRLSAAAAVEFVELYRQLKDRAERQGFAATVAASAILLELASRFFALPTDSRSEPRDHPLHRFLNLLEDASQTDRRISDLAREAGGSPDHLSALFRRHYGTRPVDYRNRQRLTRACELLTAGMKVKDAARTVGFTDPLYFSRLFRRRYGLSPREIGRGAGPV